jgi:GAF domain-containing protein
VIPVIEREAVIDAALHSAMTDLGCIAGAMVVATGEGHGLRLRYHSGPLDAPMWSFATLSDGSLGPYEDTVESGRPVFIESFMHLLARYPAFRGTARMECLGAWMFLPLGIGGSAVGALAFGYRSPRLFSPADQLAAETIARRCGNSLMQG